MKLKNSTKKRFIKSVNKSNEIKMSYIGHLSHGNCGGLINKYVKNI